jgi:hypothetical protein
MQNEGAKVRQIKDIIHINIGTVNGEGEGDYETLKEESSSSRSLSCPLPHINYLEVLLESIRSK